MTALLTCISALLILAPVPAVVQGSIECTSNRPGWADHRTLYVPEWMFDDEAMDNAWMEALCCVYTHVETTSSNRVLFEIYDGSDYDLGQSFSSFQEVATKAMDEICGMSMGSADCRNRASCVDQALATSEPTAAPTESPTESPTAAPTESPTEGPTESPTAVADSKTTISLNFTELLTDALNCNSERPNSWASYRVLYVPETMLPAAASSTSRAITTTNSSDFYYESDDVFLTTVAWIDALCCVYTHVELVPSITQIVPAQLERYDGVIYNLPGDDWIQVASNAMSDICGMSMGSQDCRLQSQCVDEAFSSLQDTSSGTGTRRAERISDFNQGEVQEVPSSQSVFLPRWVMALTVAVAAFLAS